MNLVNFAKCKYHFRCHTVCPPRSFEPVSYTHLRAHETPEHLVCRLLLEKKINKVLISGGGRKNKAILNYLKGRAYNINEFNYDGDFIESQAFAYLAVRSANELPITFPETTGVANPMSGGEVKTV